MAPNLFSKTARLDLAIRREPHWQKIGKGQALGYRRIDDQPGTWIGKWRFAATGERRSKSLGESDDVRPANGVGILDYDQAKRAAYRFFEEADREAAGGAETHQRSSLTVSRALDEYFEWREEGGGKGAKSVDSDRANMAAMVEPFPVADRKARSLGDLPLERLQKSHLEKLMSHLVRTPARTRTGRGAEQRYREAPTGDRKRARQATANRIWATLRAALNRAADRHGISDAAWRKIKPFRGAASARPRFLKDDESKRLVNSCEPDFRNLVLAGLLTGCRYGELAQFDYEDFDPDTKTVHVRTSKSGKPRDVALTIEGVKFFTQLRHRAAPGGPLLTKANGSRWQKSEQQRPMEDAWKAANIARATFHVLRHTYASRLVRNGTPLFYVVKQLGHSSTKMVEQHYGHLAPSDIAHRIERDFGELGVAELDSNVKDLKISA
jgi:integrase